MGRDEWIAAADEYVAECEAAATAPRLGEFAARMNLSPVQLERAFRACVGTNAGAFLKLRQIERVKTLLATTSLSAAAIAARAGFATPHSFFRAFRRVTGTTPSAFRREKKETGQP